MQALRRDLELLPDRKRSGVRFQITPTSAKEKSDTCVPLFSFGGVAKQALRRDYLATRVRR